MNNDCYVINVAIRLDRHVWQAELTFKLIHFFRYFT